MVNTLQRDESRRKLVFSYELKRRQYKLIIQDLSLSPDIRARAVELLNKLPRSSSPTRIRNRCTLSGRSRGVLRQWRISRIRFRDLAAQGLIPGVSKASW
jgi:small subunit ribosomal protein S14